MAAKHEITRYDVLAPEVYAARRATLKAEMAEIKRDRRVEVGPSATFYFENYRTMWHQIHEMLHIEKGGEDQITDELSAYNPLIPNGTELIATVMFEIPNADRRARLLAGLGGVEHTMSLMLDGRTVPGVAEEDTDRTNAAGKASSVQFVHFPFDAGQAARFKMPGIRVVLGIDHLNYGHMTTLPEPVRAALAQDLD